MRIVPAALPTHHVAGRHEQDDAASKAGDYRSLRERNDDAASTSSSRRRLVRRGILQRWLYAFPRLSFGLALLGCAFATGGVAAYVVAGWTLRLAGTSDALAAARTQLVATGLSLHRMSACAAGGFAPRVAVLKAWVDADAAPWTSKLAADDVLLRAAAANMTSCADAELRRLERVVTRPALPPRRLDCVLDGVQRAMAKYATPAGRLRAAMRRAHRVVESALVQRAVAHATTLPSSGRASAVANASDALVAALDEWRAALAAVAVDDLEAVASELELPELPTPALLPLDGAEPTNPLSLLLPEQLVAALRAVAGVSRDVGRAVDLVEAAWRDARLVLRQVERRESKLRQELAEMRNATAARVRDAGETLRAVAAKARGAVVAAARAAVDALHPVDSTDLDDITRGDALERYVEWHRHELVPREAARRADPQPWLERVRLPNLEAAERDAASTGVGGVAARRDPWIRRAAFVDSSATALTVLLAWDLLSRLAWFLEKAARLLTESYTELPPVDIRDATAITTLIDLWSVLKCQRDLTSVVYAFLTDGSRVVTTAIHFALWVSLEAAGTLALADWNRDFARRCRADASGGRAATLEPLPSALLALLQLVVGPPQDELSVPIEVARARSQQLRDALEKDVRAWRDQVARAATRQTDTASDLVLERSFLLDVRAEVDGCLAQDGSSSLSDERSGDDDHSLSALCSSSPLRGYETPAAWAASAASGGHALDRAAISDTLDFEAVLSECLPQTSDRARSPSPHAATRVVQRLGAVHGCAVEQSLYLVVATWWMLFVVALALRLAARMLLKAAGMVFWRFLSADRLEVLAFCDAESGAVHAAERLPKAIRRHLRNLRWRVAARVGGVALGVASVVVVAVHVLPAHVMQPLV